MINRRTNPLKVWRTHHYLSQSRLAFMLGVKKALIGKWEDGTNFPNTINFDKITKLTGITLDVWDKWLKNE